MSRSFVLTFPAIALAQRELRGSDPIKIPDCDMENDGKREITAPCNCGNGEGKVECGVGKYCNQAKVPKEVDICGAFLECEEGRWLRCREDGKCTCHKNEEEGAAIQPTRKCSQAAYDEEMKRVRDYVKKHTKWIHLGLEAYVAESGPNGVFHISCDSEEYDRVGSGVAGRLVCKDSGEVRQDWMGHDPKFGKYKPVKCEKKCEFIEDKEDCTAAHRVKKCSYDEGAKTCQPACSSFVSECPLDRCEEKEQKECVSCDQLISPEECDKHKDSCGSEEFMEGDELVFECFDQVTTPTPDKNSRHLTADGNSSCFWTTLKKCVDN